MPFKYYIFLGFYKVINDNINEIEKEWQKDK